MLSRTLDTKSARQLSFCALPGALCFGQQTLHYSSMHTTKTTSSNCKIPPGASFYQHQPLVYWTSDRGLRRACWNAISASQTSERSFARCQTWGTKGSAEIRHLHTKHKGVMSHKEQTRPDSLVREQRKTRRPADSSLGPARNSQICGQQGSPLLAFPALHCLLSTGEPRSETNIDST